MNNDDAQIAVIIFFFLGIAFIAFYFMVIGGMMDVVTITHNNMTQGAGASIPLSQDRQDALLILQGAFRSLPIITFVLTIIVALIAGLASRNTTV